MTFFRKFTDFLLYSHIFIASCAVATVILTSLYNPDISIAKLYYVFIGLGTLVIYNLHRLFSLNKITNAGIGLQERFNKLNRFKSWYVLSSVLGVILSLYCFLNFSNRIQLLLIIPCLLAALYILPVFPGHKRLRDYNFLKIFLIGFCWAWLCCYVPLEYSAMSFTSKSLAGIEKFFFVVAITLPFDFRDLWIDEKQKVQTIVSGLGYRYSMLLSLALLIVALFILSVLVFVYEAVDIRIFLGLLTAYIITGVILRKAFKKHTDYYYTFLVDGTFIICLFATLLFYAIL